MIPKSKLLRLYTLQNRFDSIVQDFYNDSDISSDIVYVLEDIKSSINTLIDYVRAES